MKLEKIHWMIYSTVRWHCVMQCVVNEKSSHPTLYEKLNEWNLFVENQVILQTDLLKKYLRNLLYILVSRLLFNFKSSEWYTVSIHWHTYIAWEWWKHKNLPNKIDNIPKQHSLLVPLFILNRGINLNK